MSSSTPPRRTFWFFHKTMNPILCECGVECISVKNYFIYLTGKKPQKRTFGGAWSQVGALGRVFEAFSRTHLLEMMGLVNGGFNFGTIQILLLTFLTNIESLYRFTIQNIKCYSLSISIGSLKVKVILTCLEVLDWDQYVCLTNFIWQSTSNPKWHMTFSKTKMNVNWNILFILRCCLNFGLHNILGELIFWVIKIQSWFVTKYLDRA